MNIREAKIEDIAQIQIVRNSVKENTLSDPKLVSDKDCEEYLTNRGKGWVCEIDNEIVGFSIVDVKDNNIWALFIHPDFEKQGIGRKLHDVMVDWYFSKSAETLWLGTSPNTRAETFYRKSGWEDVGMHGKEIKFEMTLDNWKKTNIKKMKQNIKSIRPFVGAENFEVSRAFYRDLGFEEVTLEHNFSVFKKQEIAFYLQDYYAKEWIENTMIFIEVENTDEYYHELLSLNLNEKYEGVKLSPVKIMEWGKECFLHDPSGILWHFGEFFNK